MRNLRSKYRRKLDYEILNTERLRPALNESAMYALTCRAKFCLYRIFCRVHCQCVIMKIAAIIPMRRSQLQVHSKVLFVIMQTRQFVPRGNIDKKIISAFCN